MKTPLTPGEVPSGAMANFFARAFGLFRNPSGHREHLKTTAVAAGRIIGANELLRILGSSPKAPGATASAAQADGATGARAS